ncbi:12088_t:CDS:1 [Dentiscutata erythropus]|uniref:Kynurenine formamidase n=1 Tax=Dentiscutata erythropus TaxID=1348616 RepID=A0A9N8ZLC9_9GLOM|nr:12088_t:CDS:1 [Dentiscutata erythropus]
MNQGMCELKLHADIPYSSHPQQTLDLYIPTLHNDTSTKVPTPIVILIHGGAWVTGDKKDLESLGKFISSSTNFAVALINYRISKTPEIKHPVHINDVAAAISWIYLNSDKYSYRNDRMYLVGHSIGAFLSAQLVFIPEYLINAANSYLKNTEKTKELFNSIRGIVGIEGIYDIPSLLERWPDYKKKFVEPAFGTDPEVYKSASPQYHSCNDAVTTIPPYLIIHSLEDELVDIDQSNNFYEYVKQNCKVDEGWVKLETGIKGTHYGILKEKELELGVVEFILLREAKI